MPVAEEIVVKEHLEEFLKDNDILVDQQSAFIVGKIIHVNVPLILCHTSGKRDLQ
jgi:hypothetical protein